MNHERLGRIVQLTDRVRRLGHAIEDARATLSAEGVTYEVVAERTSRWLTELQECEEQIHALRGSLIPEEGDDAE